MKRFNLFLVLVAWVAMGFQSCSQEQTEALSPSADHFTRELILSAEKPAHEDAVRTQYSAGTILWSNSDLIRSTYHHTAAGWSDALPASANMELDGNKASFTVPYVFPTSTDAGTYQFYACHPSTQWNGGSKSYSGAGEVSVAIPTEQTMSKAGTYDAKGDLLIGASVEMPTEAPADGEVLHFNYTRLVSHACITLKSLKGAAANEMVTSVAFEAPVPLTGSSTADFESQSLKEGAAFNNNTVTVTMPTNTMANENVEVWFCSAPAVIAAGQTLTVTVETNLATYTRTITAREEGIQFKQNTRSTLGINLGGDDTQKEEKAVSTLTDGQYVALDIASGTYYAMSSTEASQRRARVEFAYNGTDTNVTTDDETLIWDVVASGSGYTLSPSAGTTKTYLAAAESGSDKNYGLLVAEETILTISPNENGSFTIVDATNQSNRRLAMNSSYGFAFYKSTTGTGEIWLIPATLQKTPSIAVEADSWTPTADAQNKDFAVTLKYLDSYDVQVDYESGEDWLTYTKESDNLTLTVAENTDTENSRKATVTLSADGAASATITVTQEKKVESSGEVTVKTLTIDHSVFGTSYASASTIVDDIEFYYTDCMENNANGTPSGWAKGQVIQAKKSTGTIRNKGNLGKITNITVYTVANTNTWKLYHGNSEDPATNETSRPTSGFETETISYTKYANKTTSTATTTANVYTFDLSASNSSFFKIATGSGAVYFYKIIVTYEK